MVRATRISSRKSSSRTSFSTGRAHTFLPQHHVIQLPAVIPPPLQAGPLGRLLLGLLARLCKQLLPLLQRRSLIRHRREVDVVRRLRLVRLHHATQHHGAENQAAAEKLKKQATRCARQSTRPSLSPCQFSAIVVPRSIDHNVSGRTPAMLIP